MFKKIIIAFDGSEHGKNALNHAAALARQFDSTLWIVHAFPRTLDVLGRDEYARMVAKRNANGQLVLDEARELLGDTAFDVYEELLEGPEAEAILAVAKTREADLVVMGTRGFSSLQGLLLGSVSQKVIHHAECPVLVVR